MDWSWWRVLTKRSSPLEFFAPGEGNGTPLQYSCLENPMKSMKRQKDRTLKDELCRLVHVQYATGDQRKNNSERMKRGSCPLEMVNVWKSRPEKGDGIFR